MKKILLFVSALFFFFAPVAQAGTAIGGKVAYVKSGCDYYIVADKSGYDLLEWYGGRMPAVGDTLAGDIHSYGFKDIYIGTTVSNGTKGRAWIEDYLLSADSVVSKFVDKCTIAVHPSSSTSYTSPGLSNTNYYTNTYGSTVHSPAYSATVPTSASAQCRDGTYSFSQSRSGTCSHHGGVSSWY